MFRNVFLLSCSFLLWMSCTTTDNKNTMTLKGHIKDLKKGSIILERFVDTAYIAIDSVVLYGDSNFELKQQIESPEVLHLYLRLENGELLEDRISFFAEAGEISLDTDLKHFANATIEGSENNDLLKTYNKIARRYNNLNLDLLVEEFQAIKDGNDSLTIAIQEKQSRLIENSYLATLNFALQNPTHEIAAFLVVYETPDLNIRYLDTVYHSLAQPIKESKYGKELKEKIAAIKQKEN